MNADAHQKVQAEHLSRNAFLYVRQSTLRQVRENVESSQRQYKSVSVLTSVVSAKDGRRGAPRCGQMSPPS